MVVKRISIYDESEAQPPFSNDQLVFEVSNTYIVLMVKLTDKQQVEAFELFEFDKTNTDWYDIFYQVRILSKILVKSYTDTRVYYNICEALIMPANKFSTTAADVYLEAVHGNNMNAVIKYDNVNIEASLITVYRIQKPLFDMVNSNLMMVNARHTYSKLLEDVFTKGSVLEGEFLELRFYYGYLIVCVIKFGKLQLIQSYSFQTADDILYYLLSIAKQFQLSTTETRVKVSGIIDIKSPEMDYIAKVFNKISLNTEVPDLIFKKNSSGYPLHYFTPFLNLVI